MTILLVLLALAGVAAGFHLAQSKRGPGLALLGASAVLAVFLAVQNFRADSADVRKLITTVTAYSEVAGIKLARFAADSKPGARVMILRPPGSLGTAEKALLQAFRNEAGRGITLAGEVTLSMPDELRQKMESSLTNLSEKARADFIHAETVAYANWLDMAILDQIIQEWSGRADLILCLISLPPGLADAMQRGKPRDPQLLAADPKLMTVNADARLMESLLRRGVVAAAVVTNPDSDPWSLPATPPADVDRAFAQRYVLMTSDGVHKP